MSKEINLYLFLILKGKNERTRVPVHSFISKNFTEAQLYFRSWINPEENGSEYTLYKIGTFTDDNKINPCKVFITGGFEIKHRNTEMYYRNKVNEFRKEIERTKKAKTEKNICKQIEILFDGKIIK